MLETFHSTGRAISDRTRVRILKMLESGELCVCQITAILGLAPATVSKHLSILKMTGLLDQRKEGRWVYYKLGAHITNPFAPAMLDLVRGVLADDPVVAEDRRRLAQVNTMTVQELCGKGADVFENAQIAAEA